MTTSNPILLLVWPVPWIRRVPIRLAESLAELSVRHRLIAFLYVVLLFFVIPLVSIVIFK